MRAALGRPPRPRDGVPVDKSWAGAYLEPTSGLSVEVMIHGNAVLASLGGGPEVLSLGEDGVARSAGMTLSREGDGLRLDRPGDNLRGLATRLDGDVSADIAGCYWSDETESLLEIAAVGPAFAGRFDGFLGRGPMHQMRPFAGDVWKLATPRGMDAPAPGDWTVRIRRAASGAVEGLVLGCWLARNVAFTRLV